MADDERFLRTLAGLDCDDGRDSDSDNDEAAWEALEVKALVRMCRVSEHAARETLRNAERDVAQALAALQQQRNGEAGADHWAQLLDVGPAAAAGLRQ
jgi:hypothetical protein